MKFPSTLQVAFVPIKNILELQTNVDGKSELCGFEGRFLSVLSEALHFSSEFVEKGEVGRKGPDGNWTGTIGMVQRGEADIALNSLAITEERMAVVDFSTTYIVDGTTFAIGRPSPLPHMFSYFYTFEPNLWASFITMMMLMPLLFSLLTNTRYSYFSRLLQLFSNLLGQCFSLKDDFGRNRILLTSWTVFAYVISLSYSAVLLSFLTVPLYRQPVRNFKELANAVEKNELKAYVIYGTTAENFLQQSHHESIRRLGDTIKKERWYIFWFDVKKIIVNDKTAFIGSRNGLKFYYATDETKLISEDILAVWNVALVVRKHFCCKHSLNIVLSRISSAGLFTKLCMDEYLKKVRRSPEKLPDLEDRMRICVEDIFGIVVILLIGYFISFLVLLGEISVRHFGFNFAC